MELYAAYAKKAHDLTFKMASRGRGRRDEDEDRDQDGVDSRIDPAEEMRYIEEEQNRVTNASLDSTRRMVRTAEETRQVGAKTLESLDQQGDQLRRVEENLATINKDVRRAERNLTSMEKWCGCCTCPCSRPRNYEKGRAYKKAWKRPKETVTKQPTAEDGGQDPMAALRDNVEAMNRPKPGKGGYIKRITNDEREDEMNENLGVVSSILGDLKKQATAMSGELDEQNDVLDRIEAKNTSVTGRIHAANDRTVKLLKS